MAFCAPTCTVVLEPGAIVAFCSEAKPTTDRSPSLYDGGASAGAEPHDVGVVPSVQSSEAPW